MIEPIHRTMKTPRCLLAAVLACVAVAGCQEPRRPADYRVAHALPVSQETVSLSVATPEGAVLSGTDALRFERFVADYHDRGRKALLVQGTADGAQRLRAMLVKAGVVAGEISLGPESAPGGPVILSFVAAKVTLPECGKFTSTTTPNWTNRSHSNFGCATRRNLGLMVQDPADLEQAPPIGSADGVKGSATIQGYRTGTGAGQ